MGNVTFRQGDFVLFELHTGGFSIAQILRTKPNCMAPMALYFDYVSSIKPQVSEEFIHGLNPIFVDHLCLRSSKIEVLDSIDVPLKADPDRFYLSEITSGPAERLILGFNGYRYIDDTHLLRSAYDFNWSYLTQTYESSNLTFQDRVYPSALPDTAVHYSCSFGFSTFYDTHLGYSPQKVIQELNSRTGKQLTPDKIDSYDWLEIIEDLSASSLAYCLKFSIPHCLCNYLLSKRLIVWEVGDLYRIRKMGSLEILCKISASPLVGLLCTLFSRENGQVKYLTNLITNENCICYGFWEKMESQTDLPEPDIGKILDFYQKNGWKGIVRNHSANVSRFVQTELISDGCLNEQYLKSVSSKFGNCYHMLDKQLFKSEPLSYMLLASDKADNKKSYSNEMMKKGEFWEIIHKSKEMSKGDYFRQQSCLIEILKDFNQNKMLKFGNTFYYLFNLAYTWELWGAAYVALGGCSDDSFMDFRGWLIAQGKDVFESILKNPESLAKHMHLLHNQNLEGFSYCVSEAYAQCGYGELEISVNIDLEPKGEPWEEDELEKMFPMLCRIDENS